MHLLTICFVIVFFLMIRRPPRSTRTDNSFPTRRSSDLHGAFHRPQGYRSASVGEEHQHGHHHTNRATTGSWAGSRSEEHTSELQSLMRISYAVFCLKKKNTYKTIFNT